MIKLLFLFVFTTLILILGLSPYKVSGDSDKVFKMLVDSIQNKEKNMEEKITKSEEEWKKILTPEQ